MHDVVWGCAEILLTEAMPQCQKRGRSSREKYFIFSIINKSIACSRWKAVFVKTLTWTSSSSAIKSFVLVKKPSFATDLNVGNTAPAKLASASKTTVGQSVLANQSIGTVKIARVTPEAVPRCYFPIRTFSLWYVQWILSLTAMTSMLLLLRLLLHCSLEDFASIISPKILKIWKIAHSFYKSIFAVTPLTILHSRLSVDWWKPEIAP